MVSHRSVLERQARRRLYEELFSIANDYGIVIQEKHELQIVIENRVPNRGANVKKRMRVGVSHNAIFRGVRGKQPACEVARYRSTEYGN